MVLYFGEHYISYSANLSIDFMNLDGRHLSARKSFDAVQCGDKFGIIFVLCHCRETRRKTKKMGGVEEVSHMFCFQVRLLILYYLYLLCDIYCVLLFVGCMMNLERHVSVFELRFFSFDVVNVVFWCYCYKP